MVPDSYDASKPSPWIICNHGLGQTIDSITANPPQSYFVQSLANAGYVVIASEYRNLSYWGDTECTEDIANLQILWRSLLNLAPQPYIPITLYRAQRMKTFSQLPSTPQAGA
jgi:hypothetical protein